MGLARLRSGWRDYMEDFHFALPTLGGEWSDTAAFAVLDGHGGFDTSAFADQNQNHFLSKDHSYTVKFDNIYIHNIL